MQVCGLCPRGRGDRLVASLTVTNLSRVLLSVLTVLGAEGAVAHRQKTGLFGPSF